MLRLKNKKLSKGHIKNRKLGGKIIEATKPKRKTIMSELDKQKALGYYLEGYPASELARKFSVKISYMNKLISSRGWKDQRIKFNKASEDKVMELMVEAGLPLGTFIKMLVKDATSSKKLFNIKEVHSKQVKVPGSEDETQNVAYSLDKTVEVQDNETTLKYRDMLIKLTGMYAPPKQAMVSGKEQKMIPVRTYMSVDDIASTKSED